MKKIILSLFLIENYSRGGAKYHQNSNGGFRKIPKIELKRKKSLFPIIFGFLINLNQLTLLVITLIFIISAFILISPNNFRN